MHVLMKQNLNTNQTEDFWLKHLRKPVAWTTLFGISLLIASSFSQPLKAQGRGDGTFNPTFLDLEQNELDPLVRLQTLIKQTRSTGKNFGRLSDLAHSQSIEDLFFKVEKILKSKVRLLRKRNLEKKLRKEGFVYEHPIVDGYRYRLIYRDLRLVLVIDPASEGETRKAYVFEPRFTRYLSSEEIDYPELKSDLLNIDNKSLDIVRVSEHNDSSEFQTRQLESGLQQNRELNKVIAEISQVDVDAYTRSIAERGTELRIIRHRNRSDIRGFTKC